MTHYARLGCTAVLSLLLNVSTVLAASVSIISSGGGTYIIKGDAMEGVAGIDLSLSYDSSSLATPSVSQGGLISGAMMAANTATSGTIKIAVISTRTFSGSGPIAVVTFASQKGAGGLSLVSANMLDGKGASIGAGASSNGSGLSAAPGIPFSQPSTTSTTSSPASTGGTAASAAPVYLGNVTMPTDTQTQAVPKPAEPPGTPAQPPAETSTPASTSAPANPVDRQPPAKAEEPRKSGGNGFTTYTAVLERFRTYRGEKSPGILVALFSKEIAPSISQEPNVALSDGSTHVKIIAVLPSPDEHSPNFALNGARLISLDKGDQADTWTIETLPQANALKATLTILNGNEVKEFPLTLAPPLKVITFSEADFAAFLKNSGKTADLNNDGVRDYIDDYIYTANYLVRKKEVQQPPPHPGTTRK